MTQAIPNTNKKPRYKHMGVFRRSDDGFKSGGVLACSCKQSENNRNPDDFVGKIET